MALFKKILSFSIALAMLSGSIVFAEETIPAEIPGETAFTSEITPMRTTLFKSGTTNLTRNSSSVSVKVITDAFYVADHIYHDVSTYKNGSLYSLKRYEDWNTSKLSTSFSVPASSSDTVKVVTTHYVTDGGTTEKGSSSKTV